MQGLGFRGHVLHALTLETWHHMKIPQNLNGSFPKLEAPNIETKILCYSFSGSPPEKLLLILGSFHAGCPKPHCEACEF